MALPYVISSCLKICFNKKVGMTTAQRMDKETAAAHTYSANIRYLPPPHFPTCPPACHSERAARAKNLKQIKNKQKPKI